MSEQPAFRGTPHDWWEQAERITMSEAEERTLGNWYITQVRSAGDTGPSYRISTPSKPPNRAKASRIPPGWDAESKRVRLLIRSETPEPVWRTSDFVMADLEEGSGERSLWVRKESTGRWNCLTDGRKNVNDTVMGRLNPRPATITEEPA